MADEKFITAQTLAKRLIGLREELDSIQERRSVLGEEIHAVESEILDSLEPAVKVTYRVGIKAVTVLKEVGTPSRIVVSDLAL